MIRNAKSNRSIKWLTRNSLQNQKCVNYVKGLCEFYELNLEIFNNYILICDNKFYIDENNICLVVEKNGKTKRYNGDSCWLDAIKDIPQK